MPRPDSKFVNTGAQPDKQGYLKKVGNFRHSVTRRWFQLWESSPPHFSYYQNEGGAHIRTVRIEVDTSIQLHIHNSFRIVVCFMKINLLSYSLYLCKMLELHRVQTIM